MKYKSICCICGKETVEKDHIVDLADLKDKLGYIEVNLRFGFNPRTLNFCPSCAKKSYTIEELKTIGNYNQWSW